MNILETSRATQAATGGAGGAQGPKNRMGKDEFLKLLTTQMQAQDPLNPMDNTEFVAQLSQFTSLERLENMSSSLETMAMSTSANTSAQMVGFIGKTIDARSNTMELGVDGATTATTLDLGGDAETVEVTIKDAQGRVVRTLDLGPQEAGEVEVAWDGLGDDGAPLEAGTYTLSVKAAGADEAPVSADMYTRRRVEGVSFERGFPQLDLEGDLEVALGDIRRVEEQ